MKMVLMISEEVSRTYRELIIRTASHYDSHVHQLMGIYTGICTLYIVEPVCNRNQYIGETVF